MEPIEKPMFTLEDYLDILRSVGLGDLLRDEQASGPVGVVVDSTLVTEQQGKATQEEVG